MKPGLNVGRGKDDTLFAKITGRIKFLDKGSMGKFVMVEPLEVEVASFRSNSRAERPRRKVRPTGLAFGSRLLFRSSSPCDLRVLRGKSKP